MTKTELDRRIRELCEARGYKFRPDEVHPAKFARTLPGAEKRRNTDCASKRGSDKMRS